LEAIVIECVIMQCFLSRVHHDDEGTGLIMCGWTNPCPQKHRGVNRAYVQGAEWTQENVELQPSRFVDAIQYLNKREKKYLYHVCFMYKHLYA
jgi:hypothetical protein